MGVDQPRQHDYRSKIEHLLSRGDDLRPPTDQDHAIAINANHAIVEAWPDDR